MSDSTPPARPRRRVWLVLLTLVVVLVIAGVLGYRYIVQAIPVDRNGTQLEHFNHGSIGSDVSGLPLRIWQALPAAFPEKLPGNGKIKGGYELFGFIPEETEELPIGFSRADGYIPRVGLNCAACHTGTVRSEPGGKPLAVPGMPAHQLQLVKYFEFLFECAGDKEKFTAKNLLPHIEAEAKKVGEDFGIIKKLVYRFTIARTRDGILEQSKALEYLKGRTETGPGRVDTFGPYRTLFFNEQISNKEPIGLVDFPAIWKQRQLLDQYMHWDGNNKSIDERNLSAALGAGATPETVDLKRVGMVRDWLLDFDSPKWDDYFKQTVQPAAGVLERGAAVYRRNCFVCHDPKGEKFGTVIPLDEIGTDPERVHSFTESLKDKMNTLGSKYSWKFSNFRNTDGYVCGPLDGIWARAPYLHNGSVPNLRVLLTAPGADNRLSPTKFYTGGDVYDQKNVGFSTEPPREGDPTRVLYDTTKAGNHNGGHHWGTELPAEDKEALLQYLKRL